MLKAVTYVYAPKEHAGTTFHEVEVRSRRVKDFYDTTMAARDRFGDEEVFGRWWATYRGYLTQYYFRDEADAVLFMFSLDE